MKKEYMKPVMRVVMLQQRHVICTSPDSHDRQEIPTFFGDEQQQIDSEDFVW